jgi:acyl-CoA dehydrogenase
MTDETMVESVERFFADLAAELRGDVSEAPEPADFDRTWSRIEEMGITMLLAPESSGGFGGSWRDLQAVMHRAAFHGLPYPIGETALSCGLLASAGLECPTGPLSFSTNFAGEWSRQRNSSLVHFSGELRDVPWGRMARHVLVELTPPGAPRQFALIAKSEVLDVVGGVNIAGEPRDTLVLSHARGSVVEMQTQSLFALGALMRAQQMGGALERALWLCVRHVGEREQFGRKLGEFQAIQQQLAVLAEETAAVGCAAMAAAAAADLGEAGFEIAAAKLRANLAVERAVSIAHQCHGAIGITREHPLHRSTRRLWSWRTEFGNDRYLAQWLGGYTLRCAPQGLWAKLTARGDRCDVAEVDTSETL